MSYIECKSFVTGKENVQYPLIDVELKHKVKNEPIACNCNASSTYWNTAPLPVTTTKLGKNSAGNFEKFTCYSRGISGRRTQGYNASGELSSNYTYVPTGPFPVISQQIINESNLKDGVNTFDLFETTNIKVILEVTKAKENIVHPNYNHTYIDLDGTTIENPDVIASITVVQILKSNNKIISQIEMSQLFNQRTGIAIPIEFTINTTLFRITNFNPKYATYGGFNSRYGMWLDNPSGIGNKLYSEGELTENEGNFIGMQFSVYATEYWSGSTASGPNTCYRCKIINADDSEVTNKNKKKLNTDVLNAWINNEINVNPNTFINFLTDNGVNGSDHITNSELFTFAENYSNGNKGYKTKIYSGDIDTIYGSHNMFLSPIVVPYVMSDYSLKDPSYTNNGIYIPLTSTVFEGDPVNPDDPVDPDEPETTEPADDPDTEYTPVVPGDVLPGYEVWPYPSTEFINGIPGDIDSWDPLYSSFIFKSYYKSNTGTYQPDSAWEFINDCNNVSISEPFHALFKIAKGHPTLQELISRIYELPFDYDQIFTEPDIMLEKSTISYGFIGPITVSFFNNGDADTTAIHYFNRTVRKFYRLNLGSLQLQKVFNNYLDYTGTVYKLNLPYGAGAVELDPNLLFDNERVTAIIDIKGYLDIDTGFLVLKVLLNNQLYYETSVNVSVDMIANSTNAMAVPVTLAKMFGGMALGGGIISSALKRESSRANEMSLIDIKHKNQLELMNERMARDAANAEYTRENDERRIQGYKDLYIYKTKESMFKDAYKSYMKGKGDGK